MVPVAYRDSLAFSQTSWKSVMTLSIRRKMFFHLERRQRGMGLVGTTFRKNSYPTVKQQLPFNVTPLLAAVSAVFLSDQLSAVLSILVSAVLLIHGDCVEVRRCSNRKVSGNS